MTLSGFFAVGLGAALGAWLRWIFGIVLNPLFTSMLLGTLAANLIGGYLIGVAVEYFVHHDNISPEWRLFVIVGFLGGLTTFSSFSAETVELLSDRDFLWSFVVVASHLLGSLAMTYLGILTLRTLHG
jgi:CrcB protein